ncbi:MAG: hypothetical protein HOO96_05190 [Polyangiaceae bacterium]|nr:hypothetical protein [Polyangiaceae bacterium]
MAVSLLVAEACVSYGAGSGEPDAGTPAGDAAVLPDGGACPGVTTLCGAACFDLQTSGENCGACGHSCGGATCGGGRCEPTVVRDGLGTGDVRYAVDDKRVYFTSGTRVLSSALDRPSEVATPHTDLAPYTATALAAAQGTLFFGSDYDRQVSGGSSGTITRRFSGFRACSTAATCPATPSTLYEVLATRLVVAVGSSAAPPAIVYFAPAGDQVQYATCATAGTCPTSRNFVDASATFVALDGKYVYYVNGSNQLARCDQAVDCKTPTILNPTVLEPTNLVGIAVRDDKVFLAYAGNTGAKDARILRCPASGCLGGFELFAKDLGPISTLVADTSGLYFNDVDARTILRCAGADCAKGPEVLAKRDGVPDAFALGAQLFFVEKSVQNGTRILRIAK